MRRHHPDNLRGTLDYGEDFFQWDFERSFCPICGNPKNRGARVCHECDARQKEQAWWDDPDAIHERPKKDWDAVEYIEMIRSQIRARKERRGE